MSNWYPLAQGIDGEILHFASNEKGIVAGGNFTRAGNIATTNLAIWDGVGWLAPPGGLYKLNPANPSNITFATINSIVYFNNKFFIGGEFNYDGNKFINNIALLTINNDILWEYRTYAENNTNDTNEIQEIFYEAIPGYNNEKVLELKIIHNNLYCIFESGTVKVWNENEYNWDDDPNISSIQVGSTLIELPNNEIFISNPADRLIVYYKNKFYRSRWSEFPGQDFLNIPVIESSNNGTDWTPLLNSIPKTQLVGTSQRRTFINIIQKGKDTEGNEVLYIGGSFKRIGSSQQNSGGIEVCGLGLYDGISWKNVGQNFVTALPKITGVHYYEKQTDSIINEGIYCSGVLYSSGFEGLSSLEKVAIYSLIPITSIDIWPPYGQELNYANRCDPYEKCFLGFDEDLGCIPESEPCTIKNIEPKELTIDTSVEGITNHSIFIEPSKANFGWTVDLVIPSLEENEDDISIPIVGTAPIEFPSTNPIIQIKPIKSSSQDGVSYGNGTLNFKIDSEGVLSSMNGPEDSIEYQLHFKPRCSDVVIDPCKRQPVPNPPVIFNINIPYVCPEVNHETPTEESFNMPYDSPIVDGCSIWDWSPNIKPPFFESKTVTSIVKIQVSKFEFNSFGALRGSVISNPYKGFPAFSLKFIGKESNDCKYYLKFQHKSALTVGEECEEEQENNQLKILYPDNLFETADYEPTTENPFWLGKYKKTCLTYCVNNENCPDD
jgi:hypothetical protein